MTIKNYLQGIEAAKLTPAEPGGMSFVEAMQEAAEIWSNDACMGYCIRAAQLAGLDQDTIQKLLGACEVAFDELSVDEAAEIYRRY